MAEAARPKPNTMSSLHYTMHQTAEAYVYNVTTHWKLEKTLVHFDEVAVSQHYRPVAYAYITGPPPKESGNYPYDGPKGERDMNRGRITLPRGADLDRLRAGADDSLMEFVDVSSGSLILTVPKAPARDASMPTPEYVAAEERGLEKQKRAAASVEAGRRQR